MFLVQVLNAGMQTVCVFVSVEWWRACLLAIHHYFDEQANCTARLLAGAGKRP